MVTMTAMGKIAHKLHPSGLRAPVALETFAGKLHRNAEGLPWPLMSPDGRFVYMLPGGKKWTP